MKKDNFFIGLITGFLVPICAYGVLLGLTELLYSLDILHTTNIKLRTITLVAIGCVIFPMQWFNKKRYTNAMRGMIFPTMIYIGIWMYNFYQALI